MTVMKQAVIETGGKQYLVKEGDVLEIELVDNKSQITFTPLLVVNDGDIQIGQPEVKDAKVKAKIVESEVKGEKVIAIRYKAKKRVRKRKGHRQKHTQIEITSIKPGQAKTEAEEE